MVVDANIVFSKTSKPLITKIMLQTLKTEVTELKESGASIPKENAVVASSQPPSGMNLSSMTTEQLRAKLVVYQDFMAKYIVQAQQQKMKAVKAAELATAAKYEEKIKLLLAAAPASDGSTSLPAKTDAVAKVKITPKGPEIDVKAEPKNDKVNGVKKANGVAASAPAAVTLPSPDIFDQRNKKVAAAGKAGKSRWGDAETKKASTEASKSSPPSAVTPPAAPAPAPPQTPVVVVTPEIEAADHGLRSDGGVGGPSLAERVNLGQQLFTGSEAVATAPPEPIVEVKPPSVYDLRNGRIARAAAAGKSRWGTKENIKATKLAASSSAVSTSETASSSTAAKNPEIVSSPEIEAADHGLRSDGGVGGPSLAERVNLGSGLLKDLE